MVQQLTLAWEKCRGAKPAALQTLRSLDFRLQPDWQAAFVTFCIWAPSALFSIYCKYRIIDFFAAAAHFGRSEKVQMVGQVVTNYSDGLNLWQKLSFFRTDVFIGFVLVPSCLLLLTRVLRRPLPLIAALSVTGASIFVLAIQLRSFDRMGQFVSAPVIAAGISWALREPASLEFVLREGARLALLSLCIGSVFYVGSNSSYRLCQTFFFRRICKLGVLGFVSFGAVVSALGWIPRVPPTEYHKSVLVRAISTLYGTGSLSGTREFQTLPFSELARRYGKMTDAPAPTVNKSYWAKAAGANVILFVMETASYRALPLDRNPADFPNLEHLRQHAFVALDHHTTYPESREALFSLFTGWYPDNGTKWLANVHSEVPPPSIFRALAEHNYATGIYSPYGDNEGLYRMLDASLRVPPGDPEGWILGAARGKEEAWTPKARIARDVAALQLMEQDITRDLEQHRKFAVAFLPQMSHAPWFDLKQPESDPVKRSRALLAYQDAWIGELIAMLRRRNGLQNTIIIVVGDHGVRHRWEDPECPVGTTDDYTFHVPLVMYVPQTLQHPREIHWLTSHIDVMPTILDLLGVERDRAREQGVALWNEDMKHRTTFFFGRRFMGTDGYYREGAFSMWRQLSDSVYTSHVQHFHGADLRTDWSAESAEVKNSITRMTSLQQAWIAQFTSNDAASRPRQ